MHTNDRTPRPTIEYLNSSPAERFSGIWEEPGRSTLDANDEAVLVEVRKRGLETLLNPPIGNDTTVMFDEVGTDGRIDRVCFARYRGYPDAIDNGYTKLTIHDRHKNADLVVGWELLFRTSLILEAQFSKRGRTLDVLVAVARRPAPSLRPPAGRAITGRVTGRARANG